MVIMASDTVIVHLTLQETTLTETKPENDGFPAPSRFSDTQTRK